MDTQPTIDQVAAYWDARPCNIRHSPAEVGTREYFDQVEQRKYFVEPHIPGFANFAQWQGKRVLEIGCGIGTDAINFARSGAIYTGTDLSSESLALARKRFEVYGLKGDLIQGNAEQLSEFLPNRPKFDLIYSFGVIHHTPDPLAVLRSARRFAHEQTELRIMLYAHNSWKAAMIEAGMDQPEAQSGCPIAYTYTVDGVRELLQAAAFKVLEVSQDHIFPYQIDLYRNYEYVREPWFQCMSARMFKALEEKFGWHLLIRASPSLA